MADIFPGVNVIKCNAREAMVNFNDPPQSGLIDEVTRTEFMNYTN